MEMHAVLGASGAVGKAVVAELQRRNLPVRAVERKTKRTDIPTIEADLLHAAQAKKAIEGATHVYLCVGLPYRLDEWQYQWPVLMFNVITACKEFGAALIFLDNIYMYGPAPLAVPFDESHSQQPPSDKGQIRKDIADVMMQAIQNGDIKGIIARSADFYGAHATNSMLHIAFLERMLQGKAPQSVVPINIPHTFANVTDNGRAMVMLALEPSAYNQVWHLPVGSPITLGQAAATFNSLLGTQFSISTVSGFLRFVLGLFIPGLKELREMMYQFEHPYVMDDRKFRQKFPQFVVTPWEQSLKEMLEAAKVQ